MATFGERKAKILQGLARPDDEYDDLSPKGSVDVQVRELISEINTRHDYVTTSSCAGRIAVFLDGSSKAGSAEHAGGLEGIPPSAPGKGGGKWLFVSHDPVDVSSLDGEGRVLSLLGLPRDRPIAWPTAEQRPRFVHLKFEPMILHVWTSSLQSAQHCHTAAVSAGFRESGISNIMGPHPTPMVAIRTQGLALESIIAWQDADGNIQPMVSEQCLRTLLGLANSRFTANAERKERFRRALLGLVSNADHKHRADWEPADVRRERKRAQGLQKRAELAPLKLDLPANPIDGSFDHDDFDVGRFADEL